MKIGIDGSRAFESLPSGVGWFGRELIQTLAADNSFPLPNQVELFLKKGQRLEKDLRSLPSNWTKVEISSPILWTQLALRRELRRRKVDVLLVPSHALPHNAPCRTVYVFHGAEMKDLPSCYSLPGRSLNVFLISMSLRQADCILAVSQTCAQAAVQYFGIDGGKINVIYQGINNGGEVMTAGFTSREKTEKILERLAIKRPFFLFLGSLEKRKNVEGIVKGFETYLKSHPHTMLVLAGKPGYGYGQLARLIEGLECRARITVINRVTEDEKWVLLHNAVCLLAPSLAEGFGRTVLEGLSAGTPVVASKIAVFYELYGNLPIYTDSCNAEDIAKAMSLASEEKQAGMPNWKRKEITKLLSSVYNWHNVAKKTAELTMNAMLFDKI